MAIIAIAQIQGTSSQEKEYTYAQAVTSGPVSVAMTGSGIETNGATVDGFQWTIIESPPGSSAALDAPTSATCNLTNINVVGTYRVFLTAKVSATSEQSTQNILRAPASAFITVAVRTQNLSLYKPARGQRNWHDEYHHLVDEVDKLKATIDSTSTAANTNTHRLTCVVENSRVKTERPKGTGYSSPSGHIPSTSYGFLPGYVLANVFPYESSAHCAFLINDTGLPLTIKNVSITCASKGTTSDISNSSINNTTFQLRVLTQAEWTAGSGGSGTGDVAQGELVATLTIVAGANVTENKPGKAAAQISKLLTSDAVLALYCISNPDEIPARLVTLNVVANTV